MSVSLNTNMAATSAVYDLGVSGKNLKRSLDRLSSGSRINTSFDDAGGLAVSMKLSASIRRTDATIANVNNVLSFLQTQDGALAVADKLLNRMSELTSMAMDVTKTTSDISLYQTEIEGLKGQLYNMLDEEFNGVKLFDSGTTSNVISGDNTLSLFPTKTVITSEGGDQSVGITQSDLHAISFDIGNEEFNLAVDTTCVLLDSNIHISQSKEIVKKAIDKLSILRSNNGSEQSRLSVAISLLQENKTNLQVADGRIQDVDAASESAKLATQSIRYNASSAMVSQANQGHQVLLRLLS
jgi:flagellin